MLFARCQLVSRLGEKESNEQQRAVTGQRAGPQVSVARRGRRGLLLACTKRFSPAVMTCHEAHDLLLARSQAVISSGASKLPAQQRYIGPAHTVCPAAPFFPPLLGRPSPASPPTPPCRSCLISVYVRMMAHSWVVSGYLRPSSFRPAHKTIRSQRLHKPAKIAKLNLCFELGCL